MSTSTGNLSPTANIYPGELSHAPDNCDGRSLLSSFIDITMIYNMHKILKPNFFHSASQSNYGNPEGIARTAGSI
jgi:hypothetical protein